MDKKKRIFVLEAIKKSLPPEQLRDLIFSLVAKHNPRVVAIEEVLFSALFEIWFKTEMGIRGTRFKIQPVKTKQKQKEIRVSGLANWFEAGQIYFHPDQEDLIEEYDQFGATEDYHMLDALAYGPGVWKPGGRMNMNNSIVQNIQDRSLITGYSKI
jgi:predicted phage terminase large subunit-like protein